MRYYIGYFNKPWDMTEFTVLCMCNSHAAAIFILGKYQEYDPDLYKLLTAAEIMNITLI